MRILFLGTNGWYDTQTGNTTSIFVETADQYIVLDAGNGIYKLDRHISDSKPIYLFLSHFHLDHIVGLHTLGKFDFPQGLKIYGQSGTKKLLRKIVNRPFSISLDRIKCRIQLFEIPQDRPRIPFKVMSLRLKHWSTCLGFRFEVENKVLSYCTDTGYCRNAVRLGSDADLLISECSLGVGQSDKNWGHLNPQTASEIAVQANVKRLALVHFDPNIYRTLTDRKNAEREARKRFERTFAAWDDMEVEI